jgi:hypothetical protein
MCTAGRVELLPVFAYNLGEDAHVGAEEGEALHPDEGEGVVALELQEVGRQQPRALKRKNSVSFWVSRIWIRISISIRFVDARIRIRILASTNKQKLRTNLISIVF